MNHSPTHDPEDVPPAVRCARCGKSDCAGCEADSERSRDEALEWERGPGNLGRRLFRTAVASSVEPRRIFGELRDDSVWPALVFAALAEALAIGSLGLVIAALGYVLAPGLALQMGTSPHVLALAATLFVFACGLMVALHALWGLCIELGAARAGQRARFRRGLRFGLYACGWDLLTSPAGVAHGLLSRGPLRAWGPIAQAVRVPRLALDIYIEQCRRLDARARRQGTILSIIVLGAALLGVTALSVGIALRVLAVLG